jgi:hypothetical protein
VDGIEDGQKITIDFDCAAGVAITNRKIAAPRHGQ